MKKFSRLLTVISVALTSAAGAQILHFRADQWMPINGDPASDHPGYAIEIAHAIFDPAGIQIDYQTMPWTDALAAARHGKIDGIIGASPKEATGLVVASEEIGLPRMCLFTTAQNPWRFQSVASLEGHLLGCIESYSYWDFLDDYIKKHPGQTTVCQGDDALKDEIQRLFAGKIEVLPEALPVLAWTARQLGHSLADFRIAYIQPGEPVFIAFSPALPEAKKYAAMFEAGLRRLRASGELKQILDRYSMPDWK